MFIRWNEATMGTGVPLLDAQHRELIAQLNLLLDAMLKGGPQAQLEELLDFVRGYAAWHFGREEECMEQHRCPAAAANRAGHAHFAEVFTRLDEQVRREGATPELARQAQQELSAWVESHIVGVDAQLKPCVRASRAAGA